MNQMNRGEKWGYIPTPEAHQQVGLLLSYPIPLSSRKIEQLSRAVHAMKDSDLNVEGCVPSDLMKQRRTYVISASLSLFHIKLI